MRKRHTLLEKGAAREVFCFVLFSFCFSFFFFLLEREGVCECRRGAKGGGERENCKQAPCSIIG